MIETQYQENDNLEIEWNDTQTIQNWHSSNSRFLTENDGLSACKSTGFFLRQTEKSIQISQCFSDDNARCNTQIIPINTIVSIKKVICTKDN